MTNHGSGFLIIAALCFASASAFSANETRIHQSAQLAHATFSKLEQIKIPKVAFQNEPLGGALKKIRHLLGKESLEIVSLVTNDVRVNISPSLMNVPVEEALTAIATGSDKLVQWEVTAQGVIRFRNAKPELITRTYPIELDRFRKELEGNGFAVAEKQEASLDQVFAGGLTWQAREKTTWTITPPVKEYFATSGINVSEPVHLVAENGILIVCGEAAAHEAVEKLLKPFLSSEKEQKAKLQKAAEKKLIELFTRTYSTDPLLSVAALTNWARTNTVPSESRAEPVLIYGNNPNSGLNFIAKTNSTRTLNDQLRAYLGGFGVELAPPKSVFFNDRSGAIHVRATKEDLPKIEAAIRELKAVPR